MQFDNIKKSVIFQSTRTWPKATRHNVRGESKIATSALLRHLPTETAASDSQIELDHFQRMMRFLQKSKPKIPFPSMTTIHYRPFIKIGSNALYRGKFHVLWHSGI